MIHFYGRKEKAEAMEKLRKSLSIKDWKRLKVEGERVILGGAEGMMYQYFYDYETVEIDSQDGEDWPSEAPRIICKGFVPSNPIEESNH